MRRLALAASVLLLGACATHNIEPPTSLVDFAETVSVEEVWSFSAGGGGEDLRLGLRPAADANKVYVADYDGHVYALDRATGAGQWEYDTSEFRLWGASEFVPFSAGPAVGEGLVITGSAEGDVIALNAADGSLAWRTNLKSEIIAAPVVERGLVLVRTVDGRLVALDAADGSERWYTGRETPALSLRGNASPAIADNLVLAGFDNGKLAAFNLEDGATIWEVQVGIPGGKTVIDEMVDVDGNIAVYRSDAYAVGYQGNVTAVAVEAGEILWREELSSNRTPALDYSDLFVVDEKGLVYAFDRLSGRKLWQQDALKFRRTGAPVLFGEYVVVGDLDGYLHFMNRNNGEFAARVSHGGEPVRVQPLVVDDLMIVQSDDGDIAAYRLRSR